MNTLGLHNSLRNVFFGILRYIISFIFPFIIRTAMIKRFGNEYTGLSSLFTSVLQVLNLSELGFSSAVTFSLYKPIAENDVQRVSALMCLYKKVYRIIGMVIFVLGIFICPFIKFFIKGTYPNEINIYVLFLLYLTNTALSYVLYGYKSALLTANQRNDIESKVQIVSNLICYTLELAVLLFTYNYYLYVVAMIIGTILNNCLLHNIAEKTFPEITEEGIVPIEERKRIYKNVSALLGHELDAVIINSADNIIISAFLGLEILTMYNNYNYIVNIIISITIVISNSFIASIGNSIIIYDNKKNFHDFLLFNYIFYLIGMFCTNMMLIMYQDFMKLWMGNTMILPFNTIILLVMQFYVRQMRRILLTYKNATGNWRGDQYKPYISAVTNLCVNIILVKIIGLNGVIISTLFCLALIEAPWEIYIMFKNYFKQSIWQYIKSNLIYFLKTFFSSTILIFIFKNYIAITWGDFIIKLLVAVLITVLVCVIFNYRDKEFRECKGLMLYKVLRRC